ncbi:Sec63-like protein [Spraguea lophii 42_110]|uniref:Sec63-like protein n=1 Tax=Spraguea lophii (strain 42_110) TaxID=1358809 RepID=S7XGQ4_SPRLO|nr:Sec63-like protein [Spraguea lophii 42_110]
MHQYAYDENGLATSYLLLSILVPLFLYFLCTYKKEISFKCDCTECKGRKKSYKFLIYLMKVILISILLFVLIRNILTIKLEGRVEDNPYHILQIDEDATDAQVKKAFRKLSAIYDTDVCKEEEKKEYEEITKNISKAYAILRNKENYKQWIIDDKKEEIVAIPKELKDSGYLIFLFYGIAFGIFLPLWAFRRWMRTIEINRIGVRYDTMKSFYYQLANISSVKDLIGMIADAKELQIAADIDFLTLKALIESKYAYPLREVKKMNNGYAILMDHLFRTKFTSDSLRKEIQNKSIILINAISKLVQCNNNVEALNNILIVEKMINQAIFDPEYFLLQYPNVKFEDIFFDKQNGKSYTVNEKDVKDIKEKIPDISLTVEGLEKNNGIYLVEKNKMCELTVILKNSLIGDINNLSLDNDSIGFVLKPDGEKDFRLENSVGKYLKIPVHAPYMLNNIFLEYTAYLVVDGLINQELVRFSSFSENKSIVFPLDTIKDGHTKQLDIYVINNAYFQGDIKQSIRIKAV